MRLFLTPASKETNIAVKEKYKQSLLFVKFWKLNLF